MSTLFITGVSGFAGTNLVRHFTSMGIASIVGQSRQPARTKEHFPGLTFPIVDRTSAEILNDFKTDTIVHLSGIAHDLSNRYTEEDYFHVNYDNTRSVFDEFLASKATKFIYLSSIKAAVDTSAMPVDENVSPSPITAYGKSKRKAEEYILSMKLPPDKRYYIFRPCMIHGPQNKGNLNLLYRYVRTGLPWLLGAWDNRRSFLNVDNFNFIVQQFHQRDLPSGIYNLADDGTLSTNQLVGVMASALNKKPRIWNLPKVVISFLVLIIGQQHKLKKLTEDLPVSNRKLNDTLRRPLPVSISEGVQKTIRSFT
jgi:nucleoside-diphosphate-sugar epimerase